MKVDPDFISIRFLLRTSFLVESRIFCPWRFFSKGEAWEGRMGGWPGMKMCPRFWGFWPFVQNGGPVMWYHHVLAHPGRSRLAALETCSISGEGGGNSSRKPLFLRRNLPGLPPGSVEGSTKNRIALAKCPWLADRYLLQPQELGKSIRIGLFVFLFKEKANICVTLVGYNRVYIWMVVIEKSYYQTVNFGMKLFVWILPDLSCDYFVWNWMSAWRICFDSEVLGLGLACSFEWLLVPEWYLKVSFSSGGNPSYELSLQEGEIPKQN